MYKERIKRLQNTMILNDIDLYYFNTNDYHMSEYTPEYFRTIAYFSGFSGSLATLLVSREKAYIFVDGRYHTQADIECLVNDIEVIKLGTLGAKEPMDFIKTYFADKVIGIDGKRTSISFGKELAKNHIKVKNLDIYSSLILDRPALKNDPIFELPFKYVGVSRINKLNIIKHYLKDFVHVVSSLEAIAYILNLRGRDVAHTPVFLSYLIFMDENVYLFVDPNRLNEELTNDLINDGVIIKEYDEYYDFLKEINGRNILLDEKKNNYDTYLLLKDNNKLLYARSPIDNMKAIKNETEQNASRQAQIYDGVAMVRFFKWLSEIDKTTINEYQAGEKLNEFRLNYKALLLSFSPIVAYEDNAAILHYSPSKEGSRMLDNKGILLLDTGGQYEWGTTDITRTISLGKVSEEEKYYFTLVLKSMFEFSELVFKKGMCGRELDVVARKNLWKLGVDYRCGTGHGIGHVSSVHEFPPNIRYYETELKGEAVPLKEGMIFSDEPGVYFEGKFGIRCENDLLVKKIYENEYGTFLGFETMSLVPFDLDLIDPNILGNEYIKVLNNYHERVYETLAPYMEEDEVAYLRRVTRPL